jgi:hypothetical protein
MDTPQRRDGDSDQNESSTESTFAREGPSPPQNDTGQSVDEMNRRAEESVLRNVRPDEQID